ncbi:MAG TPA: 5-oxoprolinase subunit PxpA [Luteitalea sp.]|nr:5-oxoprolinase subunit PxpA [Luteitalea sp.]
MMPLRLDLNADVGEHDGPPPADARALLRVITSANIACGWHAGDPVSMRQTIAAASVLGVQIGAHPSYPDREGFGRRPMPLSPQEIADAVTHQVRALVLIASDERTRVAHVKPHGALYNAAWQDHGVAEAIVTGIVTVDRSLALYAPHGSALAAAGLEAGLRVVAEGFADRGYEDDGTLTPRGHAAAVLESPREVGDRALAWVQSGALASRTGRSLRLPVDTLCVHGDTPGAAAIAAHLRSSLVEAGVAVRPALED